MIRAVAFVVITLAIGVMLLVLEHIDAPPTAGESTNTTTPATSSTTLGIETQPDLGAGFPQLIEAMRTRPRARTSPAPTHAEPVDWDYIADCESGDWDAHRHVIRGTARWNDQRAGYEGGLHFAHATWIRAGGGRYALHAYDATREQQIEIAAAWLERTSLAQWPVCSIKTGAR